MKKTKYYIIWIEGLSWERGEKIKTLDASGHTYTLKLTESLRVKPEDLSHVKEILKEQGIADWVLESQSTFIPTSYAPAGTIYKRWIDSIKINCV